jgi:O-antigen ligase
MRAAVSWWGLPLYAFALAAPLSVAIGSVAVGVLGGFALARQLHPRTRNLVLPSALLVAVAAFVGVHLLATALAAPFPTRWGKTFGEMFLKLLLLAVPLLAADRPRDIERSVRLMLGVGALVAAYGVYQHFTGRDLWRGGLTFNTGHGYFAVGFFGHHLSYGGHVMLLTVAGAAWLLNAMASPGRRRAAFVPLLCTLLLAAALLWSHARSAQIGAAVGGVILAALLPGRARWAALGGLAVLAAAAALSPGVGARFLAVGDPATDSTRLMLWQSSVRAVAHRPWLGFGCGNFDDLMHVYGIPAQYDTISHAHNDFLMHAVNAGLLGLAAALGMLGVSVWFLLRARRRAGAATWVVLAALACQGAITAGGLFQVFQTDNEVEMILYFLVGCGIALGSPPPPSLRDARPTSG